MQAQAAESMAMHAARGYSAGADATTKSAYFQAAQVRGAKAAQAIRNRYYQKEFEQIQSAEFQPELDILNKTVQQGMDSLETGVASIDYPLSYQQANAQQREEQELNNASVPPQINKGGEGVADTVVAPSPSQALPANELMNSLETRDELAFINLPEPFAVSSPQGISHSKQVHGSMGQAYTQTMQKLMSIAAKYAGNPYAAKYSESLLEHLVKQSNVATTGTGDAQEAADLMQGREKKELEMDQLRGENEEAAQAAQNAMASQNSYVELARNAVLSGDIPNTLSAKLVEKLRNGDELTPLQAATVAQAMQIRDERSQQQASILSRQKKTPIAREHVGDGRTYASQHSVNDDIYKLDYKSILARMGDARVSAFMKMSNLERKKELAAQGISDADITGFNFGGTVTEEIEAAFEAMKTRGDSRRIANGIALLNRLPGLEKEQDGISQTIDRTLDWAEQTMRERNFRTNELTEEELEENVGYLRRPENRHRAFVRLEYGFDPTAKMDEVMTGSFPARRSLVETPFKEKRKATRPKILNLDEGSAPPPVLQPTPKVVRPRSVGSTVRDVGEILKNNPATNPVGAAIEGIGAMGGRALWRSGKGLLNVPVPMNPLDWPSAVEDQLGREVGSLMRFATTGSFSPSPKVKETSSARKQAPNPNKIVPSLDSFEKPPVREHYRDRERGR